MNNSEIFSCAQMIDYVNKIGILPLLNLGIPGWSADDAVSDDCRYAVLPDGSWEWPLWQWKGEIIKSSGCAYGKFINKKAVFISREWWPHFCNWRRSIAPALEEDSIEYMILETLHDGGSMITRDLRRECGFTGKGMRGKFDSYVSRLQMECRIVTEDFVFPRDRNDKPYGWGWSLLSTPEQLFGKEACHTECKPQQSLELLTAHLKKILPSTDDKTIERLLGKKK